jgi:hypothetical protein
LCQQPTGKIVLVHTVVDEDDLSVLFQAIVAGAGEPLMDGFPRSLAAGVGHAAEWVVNQENVGSTTHKRSANTRGKIAAAFTRHPAAAGSAVFRQAPCRKLERKSYSWGGKIRSERYWADCNKT